MAKDFPERKLWLDLSLTLRIKTQNESMAKDFLERKLLAIFKIIGALYLARPINIYK
jgi:hypothetical protein